MASVTTNYGFDVPTSSDLVKNGATQIALLGQDLDTFLFRPFTRNPVLNSSFNVWQRGTSGAMGGSGTTYLADRWAMYSASNGTVSRQLTGDTTNLPNIQYCARVQKNSGETGNGTQIIGQSFETVNSIPFVGQQVTFSFYARKGANFSAASSVLTAYLRSGTGTDQNAVGAGFTGSNLVITTSATLTTTWQRFTATATVPTTATQLETEFRYTSVGTAGAADYFEVTGVMLEIGNQASPYAPATPTFATELAACQRYYYRANWDAQATYPVFAQGGGYSTTSARLTMPLPVNMRRQPTAIDTSAVANMRVQSFSDGTSVAPSALTFDTNFTTSTNGFLNATVASGLTANALYYLRGEGSTAYYIGWSAEL
jgi:hypothetical protein